MKKKLDGVIKQSTVGEPDVTIFEKYVAISTKEKLVGTIKQSILGEYDVSAFGKM